MTISEIIIGLFVLQLFSKTTLYKIFTLLIIEKYDLFSNKQANKHTRIADYFFSDKMNNIPMQITTMSSIQPTTGMKSGSKSIGPRTYNTTKMMMVMMRKGDARRGS